MADPTPHDLPDEALGTSPQCGDEWRPFNGGREPVLCELPPDHTLLHRGKGGAWTCDGTLIEGFARGDDWVGSPAQSAYLDAYAEAEQQWARGAAGCGMCGWERVAAGRPCPRCGSDDSSVPHVPHPTFRAAIARYAANMRDGGLDVTVTERSPGHVTISGRDPEGFE